VIDSYVRQFESFVGNGGRSSPPWLNSLRRAAIENFQRSGFPSTRDEEWRFTPVAPIARSDFAVGPVAVSGGTRAVFQAAQLEPYLFSRREWPRLVFVNGNFDPALSTTEPLPGITLEPLSVALASRPGSLQGHFGRHVVPAATPFTALNTALARDGAVVQVAAETEVPVPVHLLFVTTPEASGIAFQPRTIVIVEQGAKVQLIESYLALEGTPKYWTNAVTEMSIGPGAWVEHSRIQRESEAGYHVGFTQVNQDHASHYRSFSFAMGGSIARHDLQTRLAAPDTEALLYGLYIGHRDQLIDNHTTIHHDQPNCRSWEVYKGILDDRAHGVFNGKIFVKPAAQKTDAKQTNRALLLSDTARVDTKPQLEIFADDVKCTHGATVGQLDPLSSFYLRSRGIPRDAAERLMVYAFAAEVLNEVASEPVRHALDELVRDRLRSMA
jgi:Fe-S cluster assembly protein SufD